ncbi:MAG: RNA-binding transcriptional accessory protein [Bacteroidales bacterium]|nr:RNA-binding transcriptional accessory protein [Bacteroidales bacterium]MBP8677238.1 RNA-binding transcriptional accessory protein [Bacteroidales bacterium]MBP9977696.1 RNA-binding transcriptional accessory protein [Bacteroidales bacterium]
MNKLYIDFISKELSIHNWQVEHCTELLEEGATIPFISRYRKERTGSLDEVLVSQIKHYHSRFSELDKRKKAVLSSIEEQGKLSKELEVEISTCVDQQKLEDLYLPYRPKRKTKASVAKERGLEPLALTVFSFKTEDPYYDAEKYLSEDVKSLDEALSGARDIIAEWISENIKIRELLREQYLKFGKLTAKKHKDLADNNESKYSNYFSFTGSLNNMPAHRVLALLRGEREGALSVKLEIDSLYSIGYIRNVLFPNGVRVSKKCREQIEEAIDDSYKRLLHPSIENETLNSAKARADIESIKVFGNNLTALLLAPPAGQKRVLALDPGFRTGCKVVCLGEQGELLHNDTIYPHPPQNEKIQAIKKISNLVEAYKIEIIAIGDGTASRETESFIKKIPLPKGVQVFSVSEDGASVYSASPVAREEFPDYDVTVRGAVSIGRRVMDPLAELVKIDPKSIGVGQYQHDVDQNLLKEMLDNTVISCVNKVGVNLNTASKHLLSYVSGIGPSLAQNIVEHRSANGPFKSRLELLKVKRLGEKAFEQCAGFLRIPNAANPLDNTAVHPERYHLVKRIADDRRVDLTVLISDSKLREGITIENYISEDVGLPTLRDIVEELSKPGRDPRSIAKVMEFSQEIHSIDDLKPGMILPGIVTNITNFGAFVDIGIKQDGLVHISQMSDKFISSPQEVVKLHQQVMVKVLDVDLRRLRIQLGMKLVD